MFRYLLTVLLINTYSGCFGVPVPEKYNGTISSILESLANSCPNQFIINRIQSQLEKCNVYYVPTDRQPFLCLMFYDINKQLCEASKDRQLMLDESAKNINEKLVLDTACDQAKSWTASDINELPEYKKSFGVVFHSSTQCSVVCSSSSIISPDMNFYCKYFKWGLNVLSFNVTSDKDHEKIPNSIPMQDKITPKVTAGDETKPELLIPTNQNVPDAEKVTNLTVANNTQANPIIPSVPFVNSTSVNMKTQSQPVIQTGATAQKSNHEDQLSPNEVQNKLVTIKVTQNTDKNLHQPPSPSPSSNDNNELTGQEVEPPRLNSKEDDVPTKTEDNSPQKQNKLPVNEADNTDYVEQGEEATDDEESNANDTDIEGVENEPKFSEKQEAPPPPSSRIQPADINGINELSETDDDHFFPLFLTGVISVVVLYVLYHNKSKVTKVVLGLIVEGRQPGRRRNSRGHAYKRLDTLEQAISNNTTAPPSKIIY
ncbi:hypothetical protein O0L34_g18982 [Tuta absoluta]|nr:hypothetical protein O0L34_g18982 [Tuta absoluta]